MLADNRRAWVVKSEGSGLSYYLLEQIDGKLYLACWYDRNDYDAVEGLGEGEVLVRWLFSVERVGEISGSAYNPNENIRYTPVKVVYLHPERDSPVWQDDAGNPFHLWEYQWNSDDQFFLRFISEWDGPQMWSLSAGWKRRLWTQLCLPMRSVPTQSSIPPNCWPKTAQPTRSQAECAWKPKKFLATI